MFKIALAIAALVGCGVDTGLPAADVEYSRTIIKLGPNGPQITEETVTAEQQLEEVAARDEARAHPDAVAPYLRIDGCWDGAALWLFDQPNLVGNQLCLIDAGTDQLANYIRSGSCSGWRCLWSTWDKSVHSYYGGEQDFWFAEWVGDIWYSTPRINQYTRATSVDWITAGATTLGLVTH